MAKNRKDRRAKSSAADSASAARSQHAAKQTKSRHLRSPVSDSQESLFSLRKILFLLMFGAITFIAVLLIIARTEDGTGTEDDLHSTASDARTPQIDGMEIGRESWDKTKDFLDNFVCNYHQSTESNGIVDTEGYCHPRLSAVPQHRTQRVSLSQSPPSMSGSQSMPIILKELKKGWAQVLQHFNFSGTRISTIDVGIPAGELVMKVPRPLQIWDLDALRDKFIQQEFLGLGIKNERANIVRHKDTQNPLDSGAFLAVHLLRLLHGSKSEKNSSPIDANSNGQCQGESEECNVVLQWGDLDQHKQRIEILSDYLYILPTVEDQVSHLPTSKHNPHSHPLFFPESLLQPLFPKYTHTYNLIHHYQQMIQSEFDALKAVSSEFRDNVMFLDYHGMRLIVLSRAFGVSATPNDNGARWSISNNINGASLLDEMKSYETSNFGSFLESDGVVKEFKLRSMCPLLDMYNSHPNPNVSWRYDAKSSSFVIHAIFEEDIPPGHSVVVSYGKYTEGHLYTKFGYVNGDGSLPTEISLAVFHRMLGGVGLGQQYSQLPFQVQDPYVRDEIFNTYLDEENTEVMPQVRKSLQVAKQALATQTKELLRYLIFDDGYNDCINLIDNADSSEGELKLLKLQHLILIANYRDAWIVRVPPKSPGARPLQTVEIDSSILDDMKKDAIAVNANRIVSICRLLSLRSDDIEGEAIEYLRDGLSPPDSLSAKSFFFVEKHDDALEYRSMMCVVRLCNAALSRYIGYSNDEPEKVGSREWNAWYVTSGEVRALGIVQQTAASEANRLKRTAKVSADAALSVREEGACPLNYSLPLLIRL